MAHAVRVEIDVAGVGERAQPSAETLSKALQPGDVAEVILGVANLPARVVVPELQVLPTYL